MFSLTNIYYTKTNKANICLKIYIDVFANLQENKIFTRLIDIKI